MRKTYILKWYLLITVCVSLALLSTCKKDNPIAVELKIGTSYQGGIIFNIDAKGEHGFIAATSDQAITDPWWNGSFITTGATSTSNGSANTTAIINAQGNSGTYAAKLCRDFRGGGYQDWFLPSKDQLNNLLSQKTLVGNFTYQIYWSSSEYDLGEAWVQDFETGEQYLDNISDAANVHTRAIRAF
jgi:hypothetical protein